MAWWGMVLAGLAVFFILCAGFLMICTFLRVLILGPSGSGCKLFHRRHNHHRINGLLALIPLIIYFYYSNELLQATQTVSYFKSSSLINFRPLVFLFTWRCIANDWILNHSGNRRHPNLRRYGFSLDCDFRRLHFRLSLVLCLFTVCPQRWKCHFIKS